jgi:hypothetical protein
MFEDGLVLRCLVSAQVTYGVQAGAVLAQHVLSPGAKLAVRRSYRLSPRAAPARQL